MEFSARTGLHAFTGYDICSAFKAIRKKEKVKSKKEKVLQKNANFNAMFVRVGDNWEVPADMFSDAEELTCVLYGKPKFKTVNELRFQFLLKAKCGNEDKITNNINVDITIQ